MPSLLSKKTKIERNFYQIQALINAAIYNKVFRDELVTREGFWTTMQELQEVIKEGEDAQINGLKEAFLRMFSVITINGKNDII